MSTLTKILIVLLSVFTIFLCGSVVTYVGSSNNYKKSYEEHKSLNNSIKADIASARQRHNEKVAQMKLLDEELKKQIQILEEEKSGLLVDLRNAERKSLGYEGRVSSLTGAITSFETTIANMEKSLKLTQVQLDKTRAENITDRKKLNETTASLLEKVVQMQSLETDKRRLLEQKVNLENKLSGLPGTGTEPAAARTVTPTTGPQQALAPSAGAELNGLITEIGSSLITISIGSVDGVKKGMLFHITRGDKFIADLVVTDVDTNQAAGVPELVQLQPRIGDNVSTKL